MKFTLALPLLIVCLTYSLEATITPTERQEIDRVFGTNGEYVTTEDTYKFSFPRTDVKVMIDNRPVPPFLGLESSAAITGDPHHGGGMLAADLALFEDEVNLCFQ